MGAAVLDVLLEQLPSAPAATVEARVRDSETSMRDAFSSRGFETVERYERYERLGRRL